MDLHVRESRSASAVMAQHAAVQLAQGAQGKSQGSAVSGQGSSQTNAKSYPTSFVLPFLHFAFGNGEPVVLPLDDIDNNMGPTDFAEFWNATAVVLPGETVSLPTLSYKYDQGKANLGQVTLLLNGTITRSRSGYLFFRGDVTGLASSYSFEARKAGDRQGSNEEWVSAGRWMRDNLGSQEFPVVYDGRRQVFFRGWQQ